MRTHYGPWQPCWISNQHQKHKSGRGPSSEHFWQVWLKSVQRFQRRRFKCEKLTDGWTDDGRLPMTKAHMAYGPGELINQKLPLKSNNVEFLWYCGGHFENGDRQKFFDVGNQFRTLKSNNVDFVQHCGGHFENGDRQKFFNVGNQFGTS